MKHTHTTCIRCKQAFECWYGDECDGEDSINDQCKPCWERYHRELWEVYALAHAQGVKPAELMDALDEIDEAEDFGRPITKH